MECLGENSTTIELFWRNFNQIYREANECDEKFDPNLWVTDMAFANFTGLVKIYGEDVLSKIKGCEFHYKKSVDEKCRLLGDDLASDFKVLATDLLESTTPEAYTTTQKKMQEFIHEKDSRELIGWLDWWHQIRYSIFRAFTGSECPRMNQAEVIHAGWVNRDECGLPLEVSADLDTRDSMFLDEEFLFSQNSANGVGCGPTNFELASRRFERRMEGAKRKGQDFSTYGVSCDSSSSSATAAAFSDRAGPPPPKRSVKNKQAKMLEKRVLDAKAGAGKWKIAKITKVTELKRTYQLFTSPRAFKMVTISNMSSCTCQDYLKYKDKVWCCHIIFVVLEALHGTSENFIQEIEKQYISDESLRELFTFVVLGHCRKKNVEVRTLAEYHAILSSHPENHQSQIWDYHQKLDRKAKCTGYPCRKDIKVGDYCLKVEGALCVRPEESTASPQSFYYCGNKKCFTSVPKWTNIRFPSAYKTEDTKKQIHSLLNQ